MSAPRSEAKAFYFSAITGSCLWFFSRKVFGRPIPWDGDIVFYLFILFMIGVLSRGWFNSRSRVSYFGVVAGQIGYGVYCVLDRHYYNVQLNMFLILCMSMVTLLGSELVEMLTKPRIQD